MWEAKNVERLLALRDMHSHPSPASWTSSDRRATRLADQRSMSTSCGHGLRRARQRAHPLCSNRQLNRLEPPDVALAGLPAQQNVRAGHHPLVGPAVPDRQGTASDGCPKGRDRMAPSAPASTVAWLAISLSRPGRRHAAPTPRHRRTLAARRSAGPARGTPERRTRERHGSRSYEQPRRGDSWAKRRPAGARERGNLRGAAQALSARWPRTASMLSTLAAESRPSRRGFVSAC
jgi:hypothetical protein